MTPSIDARLDLADLLRTEKTSVVSEVTVLSEATAAAPLGVDDDISSAWREDAARLARRIEPELMTAASGGVFVELIFPLDVTPTPIPLLNLLGHSEEGTSSSSAGWLRSVLHPAHHGPWWTALRAHRANPEAHPFDLEVAFAHAERGWCWYRCRAASRAGPDGAARRTMLCLREVGELRSARERAAAAEARAEALEAEIRSLRHTLARQGGIRRDRGIEPAVPRRTLSRPLPRPR